MTPEVNVTVSEPEPIPEPIIVEAAPAPAPDVVAAVENVVTGAVTEGIAAGVEIAEGGEQWQKRSFELMDDLLNEVRAQRAETVTMLAASQTGIAELSVRVKDLTENLMSLKSASLIPSPVSTSESGQSQTVTEARTEPPNLENGDGQKGVKASQSKRKIRLI